MPRYKILIEYDGAKFCGWQRQKGLVSVQEAIEDAIYNLTGERVLVFGAGRTDTGVHALGQVGHFDLDASWPDYKLCRGMNAHLKLNFYAITILNVERVSADFHARFNAKKRHYVYKILNRDAPPALLKGRVWWVPYRLDVEAMHEAAQILVGCHDFTTFRAKMCQAKSPIRHLDCLEVQVQQDIIEIYARAPSFLHNQIRSIAGSLKDVGSGRFDKKSLEAALLAKDRRYCGMVAPPFGLYFLKVEY